MDERLKQVIFSVFKTIDPCSHYNKCDGECKGCYFNNEKFSFFEEIEKLEKKLKDV